MDDRRSLAVLGAVAVTAAVVLIATPLGLAALLGRWFDRVDPLVGNAVLTLLVAPPVAWAVIARRRERRAAGAKVELARTILTIASDHPERFQRIVATGVGANLFRDDPRDLIAKAIRGEGDTDNPVSQYFAGLARQPGNDPAALIACMQSPRPRLDAQRLAKVTCPVLVVIGDKDFAGPGDPLKDALPNAQLLTIPGLDHFATPKDFRVLDAALEFIGAAP